MEPSVVARILAQDPDHPPLDETEAQIIRFAAKVAGDATSVTEEDIVALRSAGLSDRDILDVALAAAAPLLLQGPRCHGDPGRFGLQRDGP